LIDAVIKYRLIHCDLDDGQNPLANLDFKPNPTINPRLSCPVFRRKYQKKMQKSKLWMPELNPLVREEKHYFL